MFRDKVVVITGENICVGGGPTRLVINYNDCGRTCRPCAYRVKE